MPKTTPLDTLAQQLDALSWDELLEARSIIDALIESKSPMLMNEQQPSVTSPTTSTGSKGHIELKTIPDTKRGKSYGPYRYLRYWSGGKLRSAYLGKVAASEKDFAQPSR
jgi:hypothetical protein